MNCFTDLIPIPQLPGITRLPSFPTARILVLHLFRFDF